MSDLQKTDDELRAEVERINKIYSVAAIPKPTLTVQDMTLRDWFAGQALMGLMASGNPKTAICFTEQDATYLYEIADAMLKAREPKP